MYSHNHLWLLIVVTILLTGCTTNVTPTPNLSLTLTVTTNDMRTSLAKGREEATRTAGRPTPTPRPTYTPSPTPKPSLGAVGCRWWTVVIEDPSGGSRVEPDVIPHLPEPILLENVEKMAILYDKYFSKSDEPELKARSYALWAVAYEAVEDLTVTAAIHLADACDHYGYKPPF